MIAANLLFGESLDWHPNLPSVEVPERVTGHYPPHPNPNIKN
jgi:hypothetical protein